MFMNLLAGMVTVGGRPQLGDVSEGNDRAQLCAYVQHWTLNSAIEEELRDRRVEGRPTQQALLSGGSVLVNPSIQKVRTKCIRKIRPYNTAVAHGVILGTGPQCLRCHIGPVRGAEQQRELQTPVSAAATDGRDILHCTAVREPAEVSSIIMSYCTDRRNISKWYNVMA